MTINKEARLQPGFAAFKMMVEELKGGGFNYSQYSTGGFAGVAVLFQPAILTGPP